MPGIQGPPTTYPSKRDLWLELLLWVANIVLLSAAFRIWRSSEPFGYRLSTAVITVLLVGFIVWMLYSTRYVLTDKDLVAFAGPFRGRVPLEAIESVTPTHNPLSSPALSLDRLNVRYRGRRLGLLISPADKEGFLRDLRLRCPQLVEDGKGLATRAGT